MYSPIRYAVLTVSDRCSRGEADDKSGEGLSEYITKELANNLVVERSCVPDDEQRISAQLTRWADNNIADVILTTGGTGFSPRDVTPEATRKVLQKEAPGLALAMLQGSLSITPMAMLSRATAGIRGKTVIVNLPGSAKGSLECFRIIAAQIKHAVDLLRDDNVNVVKEHQKVQGLRRPSVITKVDPTNVADRPRKSLYPCVPVPTAQEMVLAECCSLIGDTVLLHQGLGCILAQDVFAREPLPPFPASIKDGYAVKVGGEMEELNVVGHSGAGELPEKFSVTEGYCVRISTGAPVPPGADAVIQVEDTELIQRTEDGKEEKRIRLLKKPHVGQDIRPIGSDIAENEKVLQKGTRLGPSELGVLASVGVNKFLVYKKPCIALLSTGNELVSPYDPVSKGKIRDSNKTTLTALFADSGFHTIDIGIAPDTPQEVLQKLIEGLQAADVVVSTGGVSMGERDFLKEVLVQDLGATIHFGSVLMKPGKPTTFASCDFNGMKKLIFGLPGNPVSATVTAHLFVIPACRKLSGWQSPFYTTVRAKIEEKVKLDKVRPEYHRAVLIWNNTDENGFPRVRSTGNQISSRLMSLNGANALIVLPQGSDAIPELAAEAVVDTLLIPS